MGLVLTAKLNGKDDGNTFTLFVGDLLLGRLVFIEGHGGRQIRVLFADGWNGVRIVRGKARSENERKMEERARLSRLSSLKLGKSEKS